LILEAFGKCSGLVTNLQKTEIYPICCNDQDLNAALMGFQGKVGQFPCKYLGLPLHTRRLKRVDVQPLIDKITNKLPGWQGKHFSLAGRKILVKTVLSSQVSFHLTVLPLQKWMQKKIDRIRRSFLWRGEEPDKVSGGHCLANWQSVTKPKEKGGLGIVDLEKFARALRVRWLWLDWQQQNRLWKGLPLPCDQTDRALFHASTEITIGNGRKADFWHSSWV
jgi:hypothetical protein